ncbi:MAG: Gfo/Idh/MocA family oxidoreductase [Bacilli bacterium]|nr:Gfo/Idh/MocA family oxidoreductase [Bacilli bacterium]
MKKVITYGTYDLLHYGHIRLLERAKELGDYLIVGVTSDDFDKRRGKINVQQSLIERVQAVKSTGLADEIIIEEYEGQKIDDICNYGIDIFTVGSDWVGKFDYLKEYCEVIYLDRTEGVSSTEIRSKNRSLNLGIVGSFNFIQKHLNESKYVNGLEITKINSEDKIPKHMLKEYNLTVEDDYDKLLDSVDAIYIATNPDKHYEIIKKAIEKKKHVLCESPITLKKEECKKLLALADKKGVVLMEAIKTNYANAYMRLMLLAKTGVVGKIVSVDATCTSLRQLEELGEKKITNYQNSICAWGPTAMLPVFQLLGTKYKEKHITSLLSDKNKNFDLFTKISFDYKDATATIKVGKGVKSEGELIISGTKGYIYVPAPWWKIDYFEVRYEDPAKNRRYFYQLEGEGIRYELISFLRAINKKTKVGGIKKDTTLAIVEVIEDFYNKKKNTI